MKDCESPMDLSKVPPIQQKRIVEFVNNFVISTVQFLDKFANNCEISLQRLDVKLRKIEAELCILEHKLDSVPGLQSTISVANVVTPVPPPLSSDPPNPISNPNITSSPPTPAQEIVQENNPKESPPTANNVNNPQDETDEANKPKEEIPEELKRFYKMIQFGVPLQAVKLKMKAEGFDPELIQS